jgi:hypothetical protein
VRTRRRPSARDASADHLSRESMPITGRRHCLGAGSVALAAMRSQLTTRVSPEDLAEIDRFAARLDVPPTALVRGWILAGLSAHKRRPCRAGRAGNGRPAATSRTRGLTSSGPYLRAQGITLGGIQGAGHHDAAGIREVFSGSADPRLGATRSGDGSAAGTSPSSSRHFGCMRPPGYPRTESVLCRVPYEKAARAARSQS